jgi:hypothetical protein
VIQFPSDWVQHSGVDLITAYPPELGARVRYFERVRPMPAFSRIVDRAIASDPDFFVHHVGDPIRIVTVEGEYGAWVGVEGRREGSRAMRYVAAAFMDDFATALDVIALIPQHFARIENLSLELARSQRFAMTRRPRRYFYVPPPGWHGMASGLSASWYPLDFPKNLTAIVIAPAMWIDIDPASAIDAAFAETEAGLAVESSQREDITAACGTRGGLLRLVGRRNGRAEPMYRDTAMFVVGQYAYRMRLETTNAAALLTLRAIFGAVAGSFRPLPIADESRLGVAFATPTDTFDHWTR